MSGLSLPTPDNVRLAWSTPNKLVDADMFDISSRIKEIDPRLYIYVLDPPQKLQDRTFNFAICERCDDGVERLVYRVEALDARVITHLEYLRKVPFETRFAEAERIEAKHEEERREHELDKLYAEMGSPMLRQLEHDGFSQRSRSYAKRGINLGRRGG